MPKKNLTFEINIKNDNLSNKKTSQDFTDSKPYLINPQQDLSKLLSDLSKVSKILPLLKRNKKINFATISIIL